LVLEKTKFVTIVTLINGFGLNSYATSIPTSQPAHRQASGCNIACRFVVPVLNGTLFVWWRLSRLEATFIDKTREPRRNSFLQQLTKIKHEFATIQ
jgi:hypothetical protein